jgi:menaquinone-dependent protoporphyrinogen oxidase
MFILVLFSTTEGHTRKLAQFAATRLTRSGHEVFLYHAAWPDLPDAAKFDAALLLASVHAGHYQQSFLEFIRKNRDALRVMPSAFVSVSLSAAGNDASDLAGLRACVEHLERDTLWHPEAIHHAAGALQFSAYGFLTKLAIKYIAHRRGKVVTTSEDYDLTDYAAFERFLESFAARALVSAPKPAAAQ